MRTATPSLKHLRHTARTVGVRLSDDGSEAWGYQHGRQRIPVTGTKCRVEQTQPRVTAGRVLGLGILALAAKKTDMYLIFSNDSIELAVPVPGPGKKRAHQFAAEFNTYASNG